MRSVREYLERAIEFDRLEADATEPALKKRYADIAECYRLLSRERQRLIEAGTLRSE